MRAGTLFVWITAAVLIAGVQPAIAVPHGATARVKTFHSPRAAADALVAAADAYDVPALKVLFGPQGEKIVLSREDAQDRQRATDFVAKAREKMTVTVDPKRGDRATVFVGADKWPLPIPIVKRGGTWSFDAKAGEKDMLARRIGRNELDAIEICRGYVEAQHDYALKTREGYDVHQYARRIISTSGTQDGLAWQRADGTWDGPIGEKVARAIEQGYTNRSNPYHGYFFKPLTGQGPAAPHGELDFVMNGVMIGGFALVAAPAEYRVTGVKTFIVSHDGVVYEKDLGSATSKEFEKMERFNPDASWKPVR
jgi:hypothetical protein